MTDRYNALIVVLEKDTRDDDSEKIIETIKMIKGVSDVTGNVVDPDSYVAESRIRQKVVDKLFTIIEDFQK